MSKFIETLIEVCDPDLNDQADIDSDHPFVNVFVVGLLRLTTTILKKCLRKSKVKVQHPPRAIVQR